MPWEFSNRRQWENDEDAHWRRDQWDQWTELGIRDGQRGRRRGREGGKVRRERERGYNIRPIVMIFPWQLGLSSSSLPSHLPIDISNGQQSHYLLMMSIRDNRSLLESSNIRIVIHGKTRGRGKRTERQKTSSHWWHLNINRLGKGRAREREEVFVWTITTHQTLTISLETKIINLSMNIKY